MLRFFKTDAGKVASLIATVPLTFIGGALALAWSVQEAFAQPQCAPRETVVETLTEKYGETRHFIGMAQNGTVIEMWGNPESGSWTVVINRPDGMSCLAAEGLAFEVLDEALPPMGDPA